MQSLANESLSQLLEELREGFAVEQMKHDFGVAVEAIQDLGERMNHQTQRLESKIDRGFEETQAMIRFSHAELDRRLRALEQGHSELQARVEKLEQTIH